MNKKHKHLGVGLIEVLIALFVLSIGLLGVASLQFVASKSNHDALMRSQAMMAAEQLSESMRANGEYINRNDASAVVRDPATDNFYSATNYYNFSNLTCGGGTTKWQCYCANLPATIPQCRDELDDSDNCSVSNSAIFDAYEASCTLAKVGDELSIAVECQDSNTLDADACTSHSVHRIIIRWPVTAWKGLSVTANPRCTEDVGGTQTYRQCVILDVVIGG